MHLTDEFRDNVNRFKKVPAIVDNGFQLSESVAIFRYLAGRNKIDDHWYPKNDQVRGRIDEYLEWQHYNTRQTCAQYFMLSYMKPRTIGPSAGDAQIVASAETQMNQTLDMIENLWLRPGHFISGTNQLSFADVLAACEIEQPSTATINRIHLDILKILIMWIDSLQLFRDMIQRWIGQIWPNGWNW